MSGSTRCDNLEEKKRGALKYIFLLPVLELTLAQLAAVVALLTAAYLLVLDCYCYHAEMRTMQGPPEHHGHVPPQLIW